MNKTILIISVTSLFLVVSGCSRRLGDCTIMSTKNICCKNVDLTKLEQKRGVVGKDIRFWGIGSNMQDAADNALEIGDGNLIIDPVIYYEAFPLICEGYVVKGTIVKVPYEGLKNDNSALSANNKKVTGYQIQDKNGAKYKTPVFEDGTLGEPRQMF